MICREGNYLINRGDQFFCVECPLCPWGMELKVKCYATEVEPDTIDMECLFCEKGVFKTAYDHTSCQPCRECSNHFKVKSTCDPDSDTVCSDHEFDRNLVQCLSQNPVTIPSFTRATITRSFSNKRWN